MYRRGWRTGKFVTAELTPGGFKVYSSEFFFSIVIFPWKSCVAPDKKFKIFYFTDSGHPQICVFPILTAAFSVIR